jgi:hypothetical protein
LYCEYGLNDKEIVVTYAEFQQLVGQYPALAIIERWAEERPFVPIKLGFKMWLSRVTIELTSFPMEFLKYTDGPQADGTAAWHFFIFRRVADDVLDFVVFNEPGRRLSELFEKLTLGRTQTSYVLEAIVRNEIAKDQERFLVHLHPEFA